MGGINGNAGIKSDVSRVIVVLTQSSSRWIHDADDFGFPWHVFEDINNDIFCFTTNKLSVRHS